MQPRQQFFDSVSSQISASDNNIAFLIVTICRFKEINTTYGFAKGDLYIKHVEERLNLILRPADRVGRIGDNEFCLLLPGLHNSSHALLAANKIISEFNNAIVIDGSLISPKIVLGIAVKPDHGDTLDELLHAATLALQLAEKNNEDYLLHEVSDDEMPPSLMLENEIQFALDDDEFDLFCQPKINLESGKLYGGESLIRWNNPVHGEVTPDRFVPLLEETGLIYSVGHWIVKEVIRFVQTQNGNDVTFSINLSALQCSNSDFADYVESQLEKFNVSASKIEFEITESLLIHDFDKTKVFLDKLHALGCTIALDDFGTGYTSMSYLSRLPIDVVKIDKSLIRGISENENLKSIVTAIVTMSQSLGLKNVFEGIETEDELAEIKKLNGEIIQGYIFSKPLSEIDIIAWLQSQECRKEA